MSFRIRTALVRVGTGPILVDDGIQFCSLIDYCLCLFPTDVWAFFQIVFFCAFLYVIGKLDLIDT